MYCEMWEKSAKKNDTSIAPPYFRKSNRGIDNVRIQHEPIPRIFQKVTLFIHRKIRALEHRKQCTRKKEDNVNV